MYFINKIIVKSIANEIYREAGYTDNDNYYVIYDNQTDSGDTTIYFTVVKDNPDEMFENKHYVICFTEEKGTEQVNSYYTTDTLNRRELADKLLEIISSYEYLKEVSA